MNNDVGSVVSELAIRLRNLVTTSGKRIGHRIRAHGEHLRDVTRSLQEADYRHRFGEGPSGGPRINARQGHSRYQLSDAEREMRGRRFRSRDRTTVRLSGTSGALRIRSRDGSWNVFKPIRSRQESQLAKREVAAFRVDRILGFGRVPPTTLTSGPRRRRGSLQQFVESEDARMVADYPADQQEQMAVLDYIIGNFDRSSKNYRTSLTGDIVAIDHGHSFPETPERIYSGFTFTYRGVPLSSDTLQRVRAVDPEHLRMALKDLDLSDTAIDRALGRLHEVKKGRIPASSPWESASEPDPTYHPWGVA